MKERDGIVVGGGVIGLSVAWRAAQRGLLMSVVDPLPARGASWAAAGMLAPVTEVHPGEDALLALNRRAGEAYPGFVEELEELTGHAPGYRACGTLVVACDSDERAALEDLFDLQCSLGLATERLPGAECRRLEPALTPRVRAGIWVAGDHQVDNRALVEALLEACRRTGVEIVPERAVALRWQGDRVVGVDLGDGESLEGAWVVLCAGCWTPEIAGLPEGLVPVRPVKGQLLQLRNPPGMPLLGRSVRGAGADHVYIVPRSDGRIVVGATVEEQGFDTRVTAGAVLTLLRGAYDILPGLAEAELTETVVGLRPGSPDNAPLLGPVGPQGLIAATGHYRNGILLAPVTADAIVELLVDGSVPEAIASFSPQRFSRAPVEAAAWN